MAKTQLTPRDYYTGERFERECRERLASAWTPVCRTSELDAPGRQKAVIVAGQPVLITRDRAGAIHALSNVCRHRAMTLVDGEVDAEVIRCPYHLWVYGLDGRLAAAPFMGDVDISGCDLPRYLAGEWGGFVFVNLAADARTLEAEFAPLAETLKPKHMAGLSIGYRMTFEHDWNWKVMLENFGESYHHIGPHAETLQPFWPGGRTDSSVSTDRWIEILHPDHPMAGTLRVFVVFPLLLLAMTSDDAVVWYRMTPLAAERIEVEIVGLFPPETVSDNERMASTEASIAAIHREDMMVCERVQAGLRAPDAILGPLSPLEAGIARFREWVDR